ncbi:MAG TPA: glycerol-3-phosphate dehydrogenase/oxidase [Chryseosolibacter sp.]|nr:glycerol-3-phosphate dehydrogenase/oxidase [Chryseosolibacter sp.]
MINNPDSSSNSSSSRFTRENQLEQLRANRVFDVVIIGGGATGLGVALDSAARGYRTLLLEQADFAKGTSSRSTKLIHGGVRYLGQGDIKLVFEALFERGLLLRNAPHVVNMQPFVIPNYDWWSEFLYGVGLKIYDWMAWRYRFPKTSILNKENVVKMLPNIEQTGLKGGVLYYDGQFDDARLAINLAQTCASQGGVLVNYMRVTGLTKDAQGKVAGVEAIDLEGGEAFSISAKAVVNATGVFVDEVLKMDSSNGAPTVRPSQGVHVVLDNSFLEGESALMIPSTEDGRVLFAVPWHGHLLVGTTDTPLEKHSLEPVALHEEVAFIMKTLRQYLVRKPHESDIRSIFAGLRPLAAQGNRNGKTKEISRSHKLMTSASGLVTITGGKWTTYRKMAEDTMDEAIKVAGLPTAECVTANLKIHGYSRNGEDTGHLSVYGSDAADIKALAKAHPELDYPLHEDVPNTAAEVVWAVRHEMARTVEDVLARRLRILFLNARAAMQIAPDVARLMAAELRRDHQWQQAQVKAFASLAQHYLPARQAETIL